ncbi:MAG TPA: hypothetical protein VG051_05315 [Candidatus Acidoferrum sp.]|jgi:hypothetical protein|nr:hypothetical protein [Candidatus Acidoferrum sp.]
MGVAKSDLSSWRAALTVFLATGLVGLLALKSRQYVDRKEGKKAEKSVPKVPDFSVPKVPNFEGQITHLASISTPSGTLLIVGGILTNPSGPPSAAIDWQIHLEFDPSRKIVGQMAQEPNADREIVMPNGIKGTLKRENWWPTIAAKPIAPGSVAGGWLGALFPGISEDEIYEKHALVVVDFRDALAGEWHHISMPAPEKGVHIGPVL